MRGQGHEDGPHEAREFPGDGGNGHVAVLPLVKPEELLGQAVLGLDGNGDDLRGLPLAAAVQNEVGPRAVVVIPGGLNQHAPGMGVAGLGDRAAVFFFAEECSEGTRPK